MVMTWSVTEADSIFMDSNNRPQGHIVDIGVKSLGILSILFVIFHSFHPYFMALFSDKHLI